ncbi:MAG: HAMP domain-containing histidine kinase [Rubrivivax sp.]|nr:HAMP domain-containing histidine kinase [Rubrivivax sp.]
MDLGPLSKRPRLPAAAYLRRTLLRVVFLTLLAGSAALVLQLLTDEKQRLQRAYEAGFRGQLDVVAERLRHPSGELVLLNLDRPADDARGSVPLRLPLGAIDFDDPAKAERAVEMSGCALRFPDGAEWCPAVGRRASAGAFVYAVVRLQMAAPVGRSAGQTDISGVHRVQLVLQHGERTQRWLAPLELIDAQRGQFAGFVTDADHLERRARPDREFRGWWWQAQACATPGADPAACLRPTMLSLRIPVDAWRDAARAGGVWPPADLSALRLQLQLLGPDAAQPLLFDSRQADASGASLAALAEPLQRGESLAVQRGDVLVATLQGEPGAATEGPAYPWLVALVRRLPAARLEGPLQAEVRLPGGDVLRLQGDLSRVDAQLAATATRYSVYFGALAAAIVAAWLIVEIGLLRGMALLTRRANALSVQLQRAPDQLPPLDVSQLRGRDELGILAGTLADLLARAREHLRLEQLRAHQEREQWQAVGHEIMSPLQSLLALHGGSSDPSRRYLERMQAALQLLYGQASVSEAVAQASAERQRLDVAAFLREIAANAPHAGIEGVEARGCESACDVLADPLKLEDALTHLLTNAQRYRVPGTPIVMTLRMQPDSIELDVANQGPQIPVDRLPSLFELGTSDRGQPGQRGQGLFVARGYLAKMGGGIAVRNMPDGVCFTLTLPR